MFASISGIEVPLVATVLGLIFIPGAITVAKGHLAFFFAGFFLAGLIWWIAAPRLAKPNSPWARRFYGSSKLEKSRRRYPAVEPTQPSRAGLAAAIGFGVMALAFVVGLVDGLAGG
ncbi:MAG: hypothetical protein QOK00_617 [Thermoleophilaceae bacterium]|jgi:hypothetical protein|nr:hypothetical protein [Thermoleophilaceae bacterium]